MFNSSILLVSADQLLADFWDRRFYGDHMFIRSTSKLLMFTTVGKLYNGAVVCIVIRTFVYISMLLQAW
jgi:hypothetical protein